MKKRILIISSESWRPESSGGNVLTNLFEGLKGDYEFAQIYCNSQLPSNNICKRYFHLSEKDMLKNVIKRTPFGKKIIYKDFPQNIEECQDSSDITAKGLFFFIRQLRWEIFQTFRYFLWYVSNWKTYELKKFILDFNPDIIFAPMYYDLHLHRLDRYVAKLTKKKIISYVYDDHLSFKQFSLSPFYWFNRILLRYNIIKTSKHYSLLYSMTQEQIDEYQPILHVPMKLLKKGNEFSSKKMPVHKLHKPLKIIYGGNLFYKRNKVLECFADALEEINKGQLKAQLYIYTQNPLTEKIKRQLNKGDSCFLKGKISNEALMKEYETCDVALHVESLCLKPRLITRLSFSTKIVDLMFKSCCILAICWEGSSPYKYLVKEDAAICIHNLSDIKKVLTKLIENPAVIKEYQIKSWECGVRNHNISDINLMLKTDFDYYS